MRRPAPRSLGAATLCLVAVLIVQGAENAPGGVEPRVQVERADGASTLSIVVPGRLVSYALPRTPGAPREIALLVAPRAGEEPEEAKGPSDETEDETPRLPACPPSDPDESRSTFSQASSFRNTLFDRFQNLEALLSLLSTSFDFPTYTGFWPQRFQNPAFSESSAASGSAKE